MSQEEIERESAQLFRRLDDRLKANVDEPFFQEPKHFRSIVEILNVIDAKAQSSGGSSNLSILSSLKEQNPVYSILLEQRNVVNGVIEEVVKFEHSGLNYTMETMTEVVKEYNRGREDVRGLRKSLVETTGVLTSRKSGQISMKDLWLKKVEAEESLRIIKDLELLKETPLRLQRLMQQRRYLSAVVSLNKATVIMFGEDLVAVQGLALVRETLMEIKGTILENVVLELQAAVLGLTDDQDEEPDNNESDDEEDEVLGDAVRRRRAMAEQYGGTMGPVDLKELNETVEAGLANPTSKANSTLFIRLLVRAVGALSCEEDVERMLLENTANQFQAVLKRVREAALLRRARKIKAGVDEKEGNEAMFVHYIGTLLQASIVVLQRLLYVLRLLHSMHKLRLSEPMGKYEMKEYNRTTVLLMWDDIELTINKELRVHLQDCAEAADKSVTAVGAPLTGVIGAAGVMGDDADDADYRPDDTTAIFLPSSSLAAPIFKKVLDFSEHLNEIMVAEGVHDPKGGGVAAGGEVKPNKPVSIMEALVASGKVDEKFPSLVLESLQKFLEEELMPLVQLQVNNDLREIQINPSHYSLPATGSSSTSTEAASRALGQTVPLSYAALSCASTALPLYNYWLQLPQHNDMVLTILERLVRGFMQAAREEMDAHTWKLMSYEDKYRSKVTAGMRRDPVFATYKAIAYGGCASIDELLRDYAPPGYTGGGPYTAAGGGAFEAAPGAGSGGTAVKAYNAEMDGWGSLWELSLVQYPTMGDKGTGHEDRILKDASSVRTVSCITHGCDWLVQQLERACAACVKRHTQETLAHNARETGVPPPPTSPYQNHQLSKNAMDLLSKYGVQEAQQMGKKESLLDEQEPLKTTVFGLCKDLARLADDGLAVLRAEWQIATFHFLHKLCQVRFSPGKAKDEASASGGLEAENVVALLSQHLLFFQESALQTIHPSAVAVLLSPLTQLIPRILMRVVQVQCSNGNIANDTDRSKPLRMIVACQQSLSNLVDGSKPEAAALKVLMGRMAEEFEHVRRYVTLLDMSPKELGSWMRSNWLAYAEFEFQTLWKQAVARAVLDPQNAHVRFANFDETWREIVQKNKIVSRQEGRR